MPGVSVRCGRPDFAPAKSGLATAGSGPAQPVPSDGVALIAMRFAPALAASLLLAACASQSAAAVEPAAPGFLLGLWHGFIFPVAWILSLFMPDVSVYAVPNNGGWYDFGFFLGVVVLGVGARKTRTVHHYRVVREDGSVVREDGSVSREDGSEARD